MKGKLIAALGLAGLITLGLQKTEPKPPIQYEILRGIPINAEAAIAYHTAELSVMVQREDGKMVLCNTAEKLEGRYCGDWYHDNVKEGKAIIQSEIDDGDNENITLKGQYEGNRFLFTSVSANGYRVSTGR